ncbi:MAG: porphobilinogen synthase [Leptospiraceae bacterium]|nr:porphobilinogen synthase [Leptospiraceae bacterium]
MSFEMPRRPRRNRKSNAIRSMIRETSLSMSDFIYPIFLVDGAGKKIEINSMPGIYRLSIELVFKEIEDCRRLGIESFVIFPAIEESLKDPLGKYSYSDKNFYLRAIREIKSRFPDICIVTDVALDPYSSDGHDGIVKNGKVLNDETLDVLAKMSLAQAEAGADILGPSDMMDGRVGYIRRELDAKGFTSVSIMSYSAKYASSFYGPFRDALDSAPKSGDKKSYQMDPANSREALLEAELDVLEGADFLMVKPALAYLDIIYRLKEKFQIPIVCYNVSGEYSMIKAASKLGFLDEKAIMKETLLSMKRAGSDIIITYFAKSFGEIMKNEFPS